MTAGSLANVTNVLVTDAALAHALDVKLNARQVNAYINQVQAQADKKITQSTADLLVALARSM